MKKLIILLVISMFVVGMAQPPEGKRPEGDLVSKLFKRIGANEEQIEKIRVIKEETRKNRELLSLDSESFRDFLTPSRLASSSLLNISEWSSL